jgi:hypothetical protein
MVLEMKGPWGRPEITAWRTCACLLVTLLAVALFSATGCERTPYTESIRITAEKVNVDGLFACVEYLRDGKVVNSVHLVDGDGDGVIDGKSGPKTAGNWPMGWEWFDHMYTDAAVGQTIVSFDGQKVFVEATKTYEFVAGEYEVRSAG